jgi:hypothetical protein
MKLLLTAEVFHKDPHSRVEPCGAQEIGKPIVLFSDVQRGLDRGSEASPSDARCVTSSTVLP